MIYGFKYSIKLKEKNPPKPPNWHQYFRIGVRWLYYRSLPLQ